MRSRQNGTVLYRLYAADGTLLYVGITDQLLERFREHRCHRRWWPEVAGQSFTRYDTRGEAEEAERAAICSEAPVHNVLGTPRHGEAVIAARKRSAERIGQPGGLLSGDPLLFGGEPEWLRAHYRKLIELQRGA